MSAHNMLSLRGGTSLASNGWVNVDYGNKNAWIPFGSFAGGPAQAIADLKLQGIVIMSGASTKALNDGVASLDFPPMPLLESTGWEGPYLSLKDGTVFSPSDVEPGIAVFPRDHRKFRSGGSLHEWKLTAAAPLADNPLASFFLMQPFAPPLLQVVGRSENFGFELTGPPAKGKSTLQAIMASVVGGATSPTEGRYQGSLSGTLAGFEDDITDHADMPYILDEENRLAVGQNRKARDDLALGLVWQINGVESKKRHRQQRSAPIHTIFTISSNDSITAGLASATTNFANATTDRLHSFAVDPEHGIFHPAPVPYRGPEEFGEALKRAISVSYGTAMRRFASRLVEVRAQDEAGLKQRINELIEEFRSAVSTGREDGSMRRVDDDFGLIYAAGVLAKEFRALPRNYDPLRSAVQCYTMYMQQRAQASPAHRLAAFARRPDVLNRDVEDKRLTREDAVRYIASTRTNKRGEKELRIPKSIFDREFIEPELLLRQAAAEGILRREKGRRAKKRSKTSFSEAEWTYCFVRPKSP